ncbi:MAG TPA: dihydrofolate reductase family protein [Solirubrobacteraceae bacterium]|nr:dihydrofolate reductase family protein [Solirubrobacteraceae bacterium]
MAGLEMATLIYSAIASLDGYVEDEQGKFQWAAPDEEVLAFVNELERPIGTYLYGRHMYETMVFWETASGDGDPSRANRDFGEIWRAAEKVVYSRTLDRRQRENHDRAGVQPGRDPAASARHRPTPMPSSSFWMSAASRAASFTCTTA